MLCVPSRAIITVNIWNPHDWFKNEMLVQSMPFKIAVINAFVPKGQPAGGNTASVGEHGYIIINKYFLDFINTYIGLEGYDVLHACLIV
jgi:hypothetical protein